MKRFEKSAREIGIMFNNAISGMVPVNDFCAAVYPLIMFNVNKQKALRDKDDVCHNVLMKLVNDIETQNTVTAGKESNLEYRIAHYIKTESNKLVSSDSPIGVAYSIAGEDIDEMLYNSRLREALDSVLKTLTEREQQVISLRFGLDNGGTELSQSEVARQFGVTRERIRQIEAKALRKLRVPHRSSQLEWLY